MILLRAEKFGKFFRGHFARTTIAHACVGVLFVFSGRTDVGGFLTEDVDGSPPTLSSVAPSSEMQRQKPECGCSFIQGQGRTEIPT